MVSTEQDMEAVMGSVSRTESAEIAACSAACLSGWMDGRMQEKTEESSKVLVGWWVLCIVWSEVDGKIFAPYSTFIDFAPYFLGESYEKNRVLGSLNY